MNFSKVNRSFIEIYSILSSQWMHKSIGRIETMSILEIMKITRKKKKDCEISMKLKHHMGSHFVDYSIFRNGHLRDSPPFYTFFFIPWINNDRWNVSRSKNSRRGSEIEQLFEMSFVKEWRSGFIRANNYYTLMKKWEEARG